MNHRQWSKRVIIIWDIQLFRERLSYKRGKAYTTMSKVVMGNGGFHGCLSEPQGVATWWKETAQSRICSFSFFVAESPWTSIRPEKSKTLTTHNANRHCRVRFYTFMGQPLSKQLYTGSTNMTRNLTGNTNWLHWKRKDNSSVHCLKYCWQ